MCMCGLFVSVFVVSVHACACEHAYMGLPGEEMPKINLDISFCGSLSLHPPPQLRQSLTEPGTH